MKPILSFFIPDLPRTPNQLLRKHWSVVMKERKKWHGLVGLCVCEKTIVWKDKPDKDQHEIFVCFETIEHLQNEFDILHQYHLYGANVEEIYISTPLNTLLGGLPDWKREIGHIRAYSGQDLYNVCQKMWPNYNWKWTPHLMQVMKGIKNGR